MVNFDEVQSRESTRPPDVVDGSCAACGTSVRRKARWEIDPGNEGLMGTAPGWWVMEKEYKEVADEKLCNGCYDRGILESAKRSAE